MNIKWCDSYSDYCIQMYNELIASDSRVLKDSEYFHILFNTIEQYLEGISPNEIILIKTSVTGHRSKWHEIRAELLEQIFSICRILCPQNIIFLCDGPAYVNNLKDEYKRLGWVSLTNKYNINIRDLNYGDVVMVDKVWPVSAIWFNASRIINVCKAKTHRRFGVSLSSKNLLGTLSGNKMGFPKLSFKHENVPKFLFILIDKIPNMLNIIDGLGGVEGNGPMHGHKAKSSFLVIGTNSYMCDVRAVIEMGFHPAVVPGLIIPFFNVSIKNELKNYNIENLRKLRLSTYNYLPTLSCSWMYNSLYRDEKRLENIYLNLLGGIKECWMNYPKNI